MSSVETKLPSAAVSDRLPAALARAACRTQSIPSRAGAATFSLMCCCCCALLLLSGGSASAAHPFGTDDAGTVGGGALELELNSLLGGHADHALGVELGFGVHVGLLDRLDLGLTVAFESLQGHHGWSHGLADPVIDLKGALLDPNGAAPGFALRADYKPPQVGDDGHSGHDLVGLAIATWEAAAWAWHVNLGGAWRGAGTTDGHGAIVGALGLTWAGVDTLALGLELITEAAPDLAATDLEVMLAVQWEPAAGRIISVGAGPAWTIGEAAGWHATLGFTAAFGTN